MSALLIFCAVVFGLSQDDIVSGFVFNDLNNNQKFDKTDTPLSGVYVSSTSNIVKTNTSGFFSVPVSANDVVFVIKPEAYNFKLRNNKVPDFYKLLLENKDLPANEINIITVGDTVFFPLYRNDDKNILTANVVGDIQTKTKTEVEYFREKIVPDLLENKAAFNIFLGDIADDNLGIYPDIENALSHIETSVYMVFGNHDIYANAPSYKNQAYVFRKHFGPDYYSFNFGNTHFIVLNTVIYNGFNTEKGIRGGYSGGLDSMQISWLTQNLKLVDDNKRIVIFAHIPLVENHSSVASIKEVFNLLESKKDVEVIYGHTHTTASWEHTPAMYWNGKGKLRGQIAGAACGAWWVGPYGNDSIPEASCTDGSPAGFYKYQFGNHEVTRKFIAANKPTDFQMRISEPSVSLKMELLNKNSIYVNVFDGNDKTKVWLSVNDSEKIQMTQVYETDPYIVRNMNKRKNRDNWSPGPVKSTHLWKIAYPSNLQQGVHKLKATCVLENGTEYSITKLFEVLN